MNKMEKKCIVMIFTLIFLGSGLTTSTAFNIDKYTPIYNSRNPSGQTTITKTVTVYRYGINGEIQPIEIEVKFQNNQDINDAIFKRCEELFQKDREFQQYKNLKTKIGALSLVSSNGRGLHIKPLPRARFIICKYPRDPKANTTIRSLIGKNIKSIEGPHSVISFGFFGFRWWIDRISLLGFFFRTGYVGFSLLTIFRGM